MGLAGSILRLGLAAVVAVLVLPVVLSGCTSTRKPPVNPIVAENAKPGTDAWQMGRPGFTVSTDQTRQIEGYASTTSVNRGESLEFHVPKGYLYFAMAFSVGVEMINIRLRKKTTPVDLRGPEFEPEDRPKR